MKKQFIKKAIASFIGVASCLMMAVPVMAASKTTTTGGVSIDVKTYTQEAGKRVEISTFNELMPGEIKDYYINVINQAFPAYVRVKVTCNSSFEIPAADMAQLIGGISSDWVKTNGYYYYKKSLAQNENVDLCKTFRVPDISSGSNNKVSLAINAEAIQAKNFTPDFAAEDPWLGQKVEATKAIGEIYTDERSYAVDTDTHVNVASKTVFTIKGNPMPGDSYTDKIEATPLVNGTMHVKAMYDSKDFPAEAKLIKLTIKNGKTKVYEGSLFSSDLEYGFDIKNVKKNTKYTLDCELTLDNKLVNVSEWNELPVRFYISATEVKDPTINITEDNPIITYVSEPAGVLGATIKDIPESGVLGAIRDNILTGDQAMPVLWFCIGVLAIFTGVVVSVVTVVKRRRA